MILALRTRCTRAMQRHLPDARGSTGSTTATCRGRAATKLRYEGPSGGCRRCSVTDVFSVNSTCLESPTWKTDQSSRVKIIEPGSDGWGTLPGGPECRRTPQRVAPLGGVPFVNTRAQYFISNVGNPAIDYPDGLLRGLRGRAGRPGTSMASSRYASRTEIS